MADRIAGLNERTARLESLRIETRDLAGKLYELSLLHELWEAVRDVRSVQALMDKVLDACMEMLQAEAGSVFLYDKKSGELVLQAIRGKMADSLKGIRQKLDEGVAGYVATALKPLLVPDINEDGRFKSRNSDRHEGRSFVAVPLLSKDKLLGVLSLHDKAGGEAFGPGDMRRMTIAADFSALAARKLGSNEILEKYNRELHRRLQTALDKLRKTNVELGNLSRDSEYITRCIPLGLLTFNRNYEVTFCNDRIREILNDDPLSENFDLLSLPVRESGRNWEQELSAVLEKGRPAEFDSAEFARDQTGEAAILQVVATPLRDVNDAIIGGVLVMEDITERLRMERMLSASERHAVIGKLAARIAHELNNPLDGIMRFVKLSMTLSKGNERVLGYLSEMKSGLVRMAGIVGTLLEFSRTKQAPERNTDVNKSVEQTIRSLSLRLESKNVTVKTDLASDLPEVDCNLAQVLLNLSNNAIDAMPDGGELNFATSFEDGMVEITVSDTGMGIPANVRKRIFDPFFTTKPPGKGTGLGLAICHDMIEAHNGSITIKSEEGKGSTFTIQLPPAKPGTDAPQR